MHYYDIIRLVNCTFWINYHGSEIIIRDLVYFHLNGSPELRQNNGSNFTDHIWTWNSSVLHVNFLEQLMILLVIYILFPLQYL